MSMSKSHTASLQLAPLPILDRSIPDQSSFLQKNTAVKPSSFDILSGVGVRCVIAPKSDDSAICPGGFVTSNSADENKLEPDWWCLDILAGSASGLEGNWGLEGVVWKGN